MKKWILVDDVIHFCFLLNFVEELGGLKGSVNVVATGGSFNLWMVESVICHFNPWAYSLFILTKLYVMFDSVCIEDIMSDIIFFGFSHLHHHRKKNEEMK